MESEIEDELEKKLRLEINVERLNENEYNIIIEGRCIKYKYDSNLTLDTNTEAIIRKFFRRRGIIYDSKEND